MKTFIDNIRPSLYRMIFLLFSSLAISIVQARAQIGGEKTTTLSIQITWSKTTSIIFPASIKNVDRGSRDILAQKVNSIENILQLKASKKDFPETNLTVITGDGKLYHFTVSYTNNPEELIIEIGKPEDMEFPVLFNSPMTDSQFSEFPKTIISANKNGKWVGRTKNRISFSLKGIHIRDNVIFCHINIKNLSNIDYDIDFLKLYIRDKKQFKRTASQEHELKPLYVHGNIGSSVKGRSEADFVYALEKFTIPDARLFVIELYEKNGGRHLDLTIKNRKIVKAKPVL